MSPTIQTAIEEAVDRISSTGAVLDVNESARTVLRAMDGTADPSFDQIALALIKAASRRQVPMTFSTETV